MALSTGMLLAFGAGSLAFGILFGWLISGSRFRKQQAELKNAQNELQNARNETSAAIASASSSQAAANLQRERAERLEGERDRLIDQYQSVQVAYARLQTELAEERKQSAEKLTWLEKAKEQLTDQFEVLANRILDEKSSKFTEQNRKNLGDLLDPLKTRISDFQKQIEAVQIDSVKGRTELKTQIEGLARLNAQLSDDAGKLVNALRRDSQAQGNWGEIILERLLEASGLRKGHEYVVQESFRRENGKGARLDVLVNLPEGRSLIIDSKISLVDYTEYCNGTDDAARSAALARHMGSIRAHIKSLSERNYQTLYGLRSLDFVIMFVPIEPAFMLAISSDQRLWSDAWERNILLVSPSTLLFVVRTVAQLWRQEQQKNNVEEIARRGADLYDKFVGFVKDLNSIGSRIDQAKQSYDEALGKLSTGRGNLIRQAQNLRALGVKPTKELPQSLVEIASQEELDLPETIVTEGETTER